MPSILIFRENKLLGSVLQPFRWAQTPAPVLQNEALALILQPFNPLESHNWSTAFQIKPNLFKIPVSAIGWVKLLERESSCASRKQSWRNYERKMKLWQNTFQNQNIYSESIYSLTGSYMEEKHTTIKRTHLWRRRRTRLHCSFSKV